MSHDPDRGQGWRAVVAALGLLVGPLAAAPSRGEEIAKGSLSGRVVDPDGRPAAGARVWIDVFPDRKVGETRTDADGRFLLGPIEPTGRQTFNPLLIDADGFARQCVPGEFVTIYPGSDSSLGTVRLERGTVAVGRVLDGEGRPVANQEVECRVARHYMGHTINYVGPASTTRTDADGRYRTPPLPVGKLLIRVAATGHEQAFINRPLGPEGEQEFEPIRLKADVPIAGVIRDRKGRPVAGVSIAANSVYKATTDADGRFTLRGFGPEPTFQAHISKDGYVFVNRVFRLKKDGVRWFEIYDESQKEHGPDAMMTVEMEPVAYVEGLATDAETGKPVTLDRVVICQFERKPGGEIMLSGCRSPKFDQPEAGRFRVPYSIPDEYHLTASAEGYHDAEAFTPKVSTLEEVKGIVVKLKKKRAGTTPDMVRRTISGRVTRDGSPVASGWVVLWAVRRPMDVVNAPLMRGRTAVDAPIVYARAPIRDGRYMLDAPIEGKNFTIAVDEPGRATTVVGPVAIGHDEKKTLDVACVEGGRIEGRVKEIPTGWASHLFVVAFTKNAVRAEARLAPDGSFVLPNLPPGEYGLKVGHDALDDSELPHGPTDKLPESTWNTMSDPWKRAKVIKVEAGRGSTGVDLSLP